MNIYQKLQNSQMVNIVAIVILLLAVFFYSFLISSVSELTRKLVGIETLDKTSLEKSLLVPHLGNENNTEPENCPFTWARSPENMLRQETYLTLATVFVLLRLLYFVFPALVVFAKFTWPRIAQNMRLESLQEHTVGFLSRLCMYLREPCKRSNLQGGAMNARAWASKSLATVSIGDSELIKQSKFSFSMT